MALPFLFMPNFSIYPRIPLPIMSPCSKRGAKHNEGITFADLTNSLVFSSSRIDPLLLPFLSHFPFFVTQLSGTFVS